MRRRRLILATLLLTGLALAGCTTSGGAGDTEGESRSDVGVQMFQWTWNSIAQECTDVLGPAGYGWVLTSPPQEHILGEPWWTAYQPVSYLIESRLGTREEFEAMTAACQEAGVDVIADAVINHMTGQDDPGVGWAGSSYEHYTYPGIYTPEDFHHCGLTPTNDIMDYDDAEQVQTCELVNLADLATGTPHVRDTLRAYLQDLLDLGVSGFRIDAAKHMPVEDIAAVLEGLDPAPVVMQEVIGGGRSEPIQPDDYVGNGEVFDFYYARAVTRAVKNATLADVLDPSTSLTRLTSDQAIVFVDNHDTERNGETLSRIDGDKYALATVLVLASDYGRPVVLSSYRFGITEPNLGPAQDVDGAVLDAECPQEVGPEVAYPSQAWVCQHRWDAVVGMVGWREAAGAEPVADVVEQDGAIAFRRGEAFVALNAGDGDVTFELATNLPAGDYCDVTDGLVQDGVCLGGVVTVDEEGLAVVTVPSMQTVAFHPGQRPGE